MEVRLAAGDLCRGAARKGAHGEGVPWSTASHGPWPTAPWQTDTFWAEGTAVLLNRAGSWDPAPSGPPAAPQTPQALQAAAPLPGQGIAPGTGHCPRDRALPQSRAALPAQGSAVPAHCGCGGSWHTSDPSALHSDAVGMAAELKIPSYQKKTHTKMARCFVCIKDNHTVAPNPEFPPVKHFCCWQAASGGCKAAGGKPGCAWAAALQPLCNLCRCSAPMLNKNTSEPGSA